MLQKRNRKVKNLLEG